MNTGRANALRALWRALSGRRGRGSPPVSEQLMAVPRMAWLTLRGTYPGLDRRRLGLMVLAALYVISPVDLVPEGLLLAFGLADDAMVLAWLAGTVLTETEAFLAWEAGRGARMADGEKVVPGQVV